MGATDFLLKDGFSNPFADVEISPVMVAGETIPSKIAVRVKQDDGIFSNKPYIMSSDYRLIKNDIVHQALLDIMSRHGGEWTALKTMWDARRYAMFFISREAIAGSDLRVGILGRNSYDGSCIFSIEIFACHMACTNQYHDRNRFGYFAIRHTGKLDFDFDDALKNISAGAKNVVAIMPKLDGMKAVQIGVPDITHAVQNLPSFPTSKWGSVLNKLEDMSVFSFFQAMTNVATHEMAGFNALSVNEDVVKFFLR